MAVCNHIPDDLTPPSPGATGCEECLAMNQRNWVHLRLCQECGHVGCCDNSLGMHATAHFRASHHALIRSFEPGEDWWWCYPDQVSFFIDEAPPAPSYKGG